MTRLRPILLLVALLGLSQAAIAHELRPAFLELIETAPDRFDVLWKVPARGEARLALDATLPESCTETGPRTVTDTGAAVSSRWSVACAGGLAGRTIAIGGEMLGKARGHKAGLFSAKFYSDKLMDWSMKDQAFKVQMFRFVDAFPMFRTPDAIHEHLVDYLTQPGVKTP